MCIGAEPVRMEPEVFRSASVCAAQQRSDLHYMNMMVSCIFSICIHLLYIYIYIYIYIHTHTHSAQRQQHRQHASAPRAGRWRRSEGGMLLGRGRTRVWCLISVARRMCPTPPCVMAW